MIKAIVRLTVLALIVLGVAVVLTGCDMDPVQVKISGPESTALWSTHVSLNPTNATDDDVTYVVTVADKTGKQRGSWQVVWKKNERRSGKYATFELTVEERKLYTGPGPDGTGKDITADFTITIRKR